MVEIGGEIGGIWVNGKGLPWGRLKDQEKEEGYLASFYIAAGEGGSWMSERCSTWPSVPLELQRYASPYYSKEFPKRFLSDKPKLLTFPHTQS